MKKQISTNKAQSAPNLLSQAIVANGFLFTSGFIHLTAEGELVQGSTQDKLKQVMTNIQQTLFAANLDFNNVVKATIYVTDISILKDLNELWITYFKNPLPAREAVCVKELPLGASIEISVIASLAE